MQNEKTTEQLIKERFDEIPLEIKDAITKSGWEQEVRKLSQEYNLRIDQGNLLENQILLLMLGLQDINGFFEELQEEIENDDNKLENLLEDVRESVIGKVRNIIREGSMEDMKEEVEDTKPLAAMSSNPPANFVRDDVDMVNDDDEILTLTRDEILRGIEDPEEVTEENQILPDLKDSNVMPKESEANNSSNSGILNSFRNDKSSENKTEDKELQIDSKTPENLPTVNIPPEKKEESVDPVDAGLNNQISSSIKNYKQTDPYREPIE